MLIKKLNLIGFGRFNNKEIHIKEGINLIYGENEAGKSTIHSFIDGMFYGFLRPDVKSTLYLDEHDKYNPWNSSKYAGTMEFSFDDKPYEIEREFTKGKESTKIINGLTGEDITRSIDAGKGKVLQPGVHFFNFNTRVFRNTILIKQLSSKTEDKLANEIREKLINTSKSMDDNISIDKTLAELRAKMSEIGTDRASTKPYARNLESIDKLYRKKEEILLEKSSYEAYLEEKDRLNKELIKEENRFSALKINMEDIEILDKARKLEEAKILSDEINILKEKIDKLSKYRNLSMEEYKDAINISNSLDFAKKDLKEKELELTEIENRIRELEDENKNNKDEGGGDLAKDYSEYEIKEEEVNKLLYSNPDSAIEFLKRDYYEGEKKTSKYKKTQILLGIIVLSNVFLIFSALNLTGKHFPLSGMLAIFLVFFIYNFIILKKQSQSTKKLEMKLKEYQEKENEKKQRINNIENSMKEIIKKYNVATKLELKRLLDMFLIKEYKKEERYNLYNELNRKKNSLGEKLIEYKINIGNNLKELEKILEKNLVNSIDEFNKGLEKKSTYEKNISERESKEEILNRVLGENTLEDLANELNDKNIDMSALNLDRNQLQYEIDRSRDSISDYKIALSGVEENINILGKDIEKLVEIEEEINRKNQIKLEFENEYKSLELAHNTIEKLSKEIHSEFAPTLNKNLSKTIERITNGKYNRIRVDEDLNISVENPVTKENIKIDSLSGGTMDQLYFSLRFSITNSLQYNRFPLILDDCFIQYDDNRLKNIMEFLIDISKDRQIILFTCQNREIEIFNDLGTEYNLINLV